MSDNNSDVPLVDQDNVSEGQAVKKIQLTEQQGNVLVG